MDIGIVEIGQSGHKTKRHRNSGDRNSGDRTKWR